MINHQQINKLLAWFGYGYFKEADVVFWGNEEGLGGLPKEAAIARCEVYGKNQETWINSNNWEDGYWDETGVEGTKQLKEATKRLLLQQGQDLDEKNEKRYRGPFLTFTSRMLLALEQPENPWFERRNYYTSTPEYKGLWDTINDYVREGLYENNHKVKAALIDWRPLPRFDEKVWPFEGLDQKQYIKAFNLKSNYQKRIEKLLSGEITTDIFKEDIYLKMLYKRILLLRKVIETFDFPIMLGIGAPEDKMKAIKTVFNEYNPVFTKQTFSNGKRYYEANIQLPNRTLKIILTMFFNDFSSSLQLTGLEDLTNIVREHLKAEKRIPSLV
ncbi:hypothetical protein [Peribacillus sp. NPDC097295]|uniref:hypothetical protein n=1 Tax=Peribacillus sp. NPDC097295 TaxID=3364402 RepID=UPI0037FB51FA